MAGNPAYCVQREFRIFGKRRWTVFFGASPVGNFADRDSAIAAATEEAKRTASLGRLTEVRVNDGYGLELLASFNGPSAAEPPPAEPAPPRETLADDGF